METLDGMKSTESTETSVVISYNYNKSDIITTTHTTTTDIASDDEDTLSFQLIFYILTGCAMAGIVFCVCTCCCFGWILNKKIKILTSELEFHQNSKELYQTNSNAQNDRRPSTKLLSLSNLFGSKEQKSMRIPTVSGD